MQYYLFRLGCASIIVLTLIGCQRSGLYSLDETAPFSAYTDRNVTIKRGFRLIAFNGFRNSEVEYAIFYPEGDESPDTAAMTRGRIVKSILVEPGHGAHVGHTRLRFDNNWLWGDRFAYLWTEFEIANVGADWPSSVKLDFNPAFTSKDGSGYLLTPRDFDAAGPHPTGDVRPAPWEPVDTPLCRRFPWPTTAPIVPP